MYFCGQSKEDAPGNHSVTINTAFESFVLSGLGWTTTPPTVEGWYWVYSDGEINLVNVFRNYDAWIVRRDDRTAWIEMLNTAHWLGPLPLPEPPKG
jgi:hypothetical protein